MCNLRVQLVNLVVQAIQENQVRQGQLDLPVPLDQLGQQYVHFVRIF